jgi:RNA polymerase sigma-70 factor, ECF subfamily
MDDPELTDESLMQRFAGGEAEAFDRLYRRHELKVWRYLERTVRDRAAADDLMQEVWFSVAREAAGYRPTARFTTWLFTIAHHRAIDWLRAARPNASLDDPDQAETMAFALADPAPGPEARAGHAADGARLLAALATLPEEQRDAFLLQAEGGFSVEEIASATGASFETAKSRLRYARARLRERLAEVR